MDIEQFRPVALPFFIAMLCLSLVLSVATAAIDTYRVPRFSRSRRLGQRLALAVAVRRWRLEHGEAVVLWLNYVSLTKREIVDQAEARGWRYQRQDMYAAGWPIHFVPGILVAGELTREARLRPELCDRSAPPAVREMVPVAEPQPAERRSTPPIVRYLRSAAFAVLLLGLFVAWVIAASGGRSGLWQSVLILAVGAAVVLVLCAGVVRIRMKPERYR